MAYLNLITDPYGRTTPTHCIFNLFTKSVIVSGTPLYAKRIAISLRNISINSILITFARPRSRAGFDIEIKADKSKLKFT